MLGGAGFYYVRARGTTTTTSMSTVDVSAGSSMEEDAAGHHHGDDSADQDTGMGHEMAPLATDVADFTDGDVLARVTTTATEPYVTV